jgi:hypothetical protein
MSAQEGRLGERSSPARVSSTAEPAVAAPTARWQRLLRILRGSLTLATTSGNRCAAMTIPESAVDRHSLARPGNPSKQESRQKPAFCRLEILLRKCS